MFNTKTITSILFILLTLFLSACSPFGNSSLIETIGRNVGFLNTPTTVKASPSGGQVAVTAPDGNGNSYRINVGVSNSTARVKNTCNAQGYCMELSVSR